jgi:holliday junction DNA helicase RuvA
MIASLRGELFARNSDSLIIDVRGVGYEVFISRLNQDKLPAIGQETFLYIHTEVREDALTLYGFSDPTEKKIFLLLLGVSGVGPRLALNILSGMPAAELAAAIHSEDIGRLTRIQGVGKKTAERLCLELKEKVRFMPELTAPASAIVTADPGTGDQRSADAISALMNLGYSPVQARESLKAVRFRTPPEMFASMGLEELLRQALRSLA